MASKKNSKNFLFINIENLSFYKERFILLRDKYKKMILKDLFLPNKKYHEINRS